MYRTFKPPEFLIVKITVIIKIFMMCSSQKLKRIEHVFISVQRLQNIEYYKKKKTNKHERKNTELHYKMLY